MMALGEIAAKLGFPVFPCDGEKKPIVAGGFKAATRDAPSIVRAFSTSAAQMIGMPTGKASSVVVIDVDVKNGAKGRDWLTEHEDALPPTRTHKTRSGGLHLLFTVPAEVEIRNSASRVAMGVDVRGEGGYIIVPPSPGYEIADDTPPAEMPRWLINACLRPAPLPEPPPPRPTSRHEDSANGSPYGLAALDGECHTIAGASPGCQEPALNDGALRMGSLVAAGLLGRSYAAQRLIAAGMQMRNGDAHHPWARSEVTDKVERGLLDGAQRPRLVKDRADYRPPSQAPAGGSVRPSPEHDDPGVPPVVPAKAAPQLLPLAWFEEIEAQQDALDFVQGVLTEQGASVVYGESNSGKTFFVTDLALCVAASKEWMGRRVEGGPVAYCVLEGGMGFRNRVSAWRTEHNMEDACIPFAAIPASINLLAADADTPRLVQTIKAAEERAGAPFRLIVVDTLSRAMAGGNENAPEDMGALVRNMDLIREQTGAHLLFIHHSGKDASRGARGHSLLRAAVDTEIEVTSDEDAGTRCAKVVKQREMPKGMAFGFVLNVVEIGHNRHAEPVTSCIVSPVAEDAPAPGRKKLTGHTLRAHEILSDLIAASGQDGSAGAPAGCRSVPERWWRERFYERAMPGAEQEAKKRAFRRAADHLVEHHRVGMGGGRVWAL